MDSLWFSSPQLQLEKTSNLCFISHLGQLKQLESLIQYENITEITLVILFTRANLKMPEIIRQQVSDSMFKQIAMLELPMQPNRINVRKLGYIKRSYKKVLESVSPKRVYVLSFDSHYVFINDIAQANGIEVNLIEEGTATYKYVGSQKTVNSPGNFNERFNKFLIQYVPFFYGLKSSLGYAKNYKSVYAAYPEMLECFDFEKSERFFLHAGGLTYSEVTQQLANKYGINGRDFLYVSQRYPINNFDYAKTLIGILEKISKQFNRRIFIKLHPKDTPAFRKALVAEIGRNIDNDKKIFLIKEAEFLIEPAIGLIRPEVVLGLTSTTLVYTNLVSVNSKAVSLAPYFLKSLSESQSQSDNKQAFEVIDQHYKIINIFKQVQHVTSESDLEQILLVQAESGVVDKSLGDIDSHVEVASQAYRESKYLKALCNLQWAYPEGLEKMPIDSFIDYLNVNRKVSGAVYVRELLFSVLRDSRKYLIAGILNNSKFYNYVAKDITALHEQGEYDEAMSLVSLVTKVAEANLHYRELILAVTIEQCHILLHRGQFEEAWELNNQTINNEDITFTPDDAANLLLQRYLCFLGISQDHRNLVWESPTRLIDILENQSYVLRGLIAGWECLLSRQNEKCVELLLEIQKRDSMLIRCLQPDLLLAKAYRKLGDYTSAFRSLVKAEKYRKSFYAIQIEIAELNYAKNDWAKYKASYRRAYPGQFLFSEYRTLPNVLNASIHVRDLDDAITAYQLMRDEDVKFLDSDVLENFIEFLGTEEKWEQLINFHHRFHRVGLKRVWPIALAYRKKGDLESACSIIESVPLHASTSEELRFIAELYVLLNKKDDSRAYWAELLRKFPESAPQHAWNYL